MNGGLVIVSGHSDQTLKSWAASLAIHLFLVAIAVTIMPKLTLVAEQEPFKWEVALVERASEVSSPDVPAQTPKVQPPKPLQSQSTRPVEPPPEMVMPRVAPQPVQPMQEIAQGQPNPVEPQEIKKHEVTQPEPLVKEVVPAEVVEEVAREVTPVVEPVVTAQTYVASTSAAPQSVAEHHSEPAAMASAPTVAVAEPAPVSPSPSPAVAAPSVPVAHEQPPVVASAVAPRPATKADYAWLAESLGRRIAALTRYPSTARLNGWEGRVVLRAVIRADGHLADVTVQRSSGYDALDRAALETIRLACPLHMKHALTTPEVAVNVPIVYSLLN